MVGGPGGVYPGWWEDGRAGRGYTGYPASPSQVPTFSLFLRLSPTYGQMKVNSRLLMRFPKIGSRIDLRMTHIDPQIDPPEPVPRWSRDGLPDPDIQTSDILWSIIGTI